MTQASVAGALHEADLRHQPRLEPRHAALARGIDEGRRGAHERAKPSGEVAERRRREAGADLARVAQTIAVEGADENRAEVRARASRLRAATDDELLLGADLDFSPRQRALSRLVRRRLVLGHDALEA